MAKMKCVAYIPIEAVEDDTKTVVRFLPGEIKEVKDDQVERFLNRYPGLLEVFDAKAEKEKMEREAKSLEAPLDVVDDSVTQNPFECLECGFVAKNKIGLISHMKRHPKEADTKDIL